MSRPDASERRKQALKAGHGAERKAMLALMLKGYRPLASRYGGVGGEIDLIMRRGATIAFIEVKARDSLMSGMLSVTGEKQRLIGMAMRRWLAQNPWAQGCTFRGDVVVIVPRRWPHHVPDAFVLPG
jgi:putative endonuclease